MNEPIESKSDISDLIKTSKIEEMELIAKDFHVDSRNSAEQALSMTMQARKIKNSLEECRKKNNQTTF